MKTKMWHDINPERSTPKATVFDSYNFWQRFLGQRLSCNTARTLIRVGNGNQKPSCCTYPVSIGLSLTQASKGARQDGVT